MAPRISVCIPAYNRSALLTPLLDTIVDQDYRDFEIVICEDGSPERQQIRSVVEQFSARCPDLIRYIENPANLGFDGNIRTLLHEAEGEYCLFMGNDDLICPGALTTVASALDRYPNIGVVLRSYAAFTGTPDKIDQVFRYFPHETFFPAGPDTIVTFYRRCVVIPGVVLHRQEALKYDTDRFDGTLLYQIFLVGNILTTMNGVSLPEIIVLYRNGGIPEFGNSPKERGRFVPTTRTPESSLHFMRGMLQIAHYIGVSRGVPVYRRILRDIGNYSYPILSVQADKSLSTYLRYSFNLSRLGFWSNPLFYGYFLSILALGPRRVEKVIRFLKQRVGHTPTIGRLYTGDTA